MGQVVIKLCELDVKRAILPRPVITMVEVSSSQCIHLFLDSVYFPHKLFIYTSYCCRVTVVLLSCYSHAAVVLLSSSVVLLSCCCRVTVVFCRATVILPCYSTVVLLSSSVVLLSCHCRLLSCYCHATVVFCRATIMLLSSSVVLPSCSRTDCFQP